MFTSAITAYNEMLDSAIVPVVNLSTVLDLLCWRWRRRVARGRRVRRGDGRGRVLGGEIAGDDAKDSARHSNRREHHREQNDRIHL
tara:strand:+ start:555 stop:812 length:258 start_codon:yes stop_codon:yes gene_type:complete